MSTLITDGFDPSEPQKIEHNYQPHNIVYGAQGWTDVLDGATLEVLVGIGAVRLLRTHYGVGWETRVYVTREGTGPK